MFLVKVCSINYVTHIYIEKLFSPENYNLIGCPTFLLSKFAIPNHGLLCGNVTHSKLIFKPPMSIYPCLKNTAVWMVNSFNN